MLPIMAGRVVIPVAVIAIYAIAVIMMATIESERIAHVVARVIMMAVAMIAGADGYAI